MKERRKKFRRIQDSIIIETKLFIRSRSTKVFLLLWFATLLYFCISVFGNHEIGTAFRGSGWLTQILIVCGMTIGVLHASMERREWCEEVIESLPHGISCKAVAKIVLLLGTGMVLFFSSVITVVMVFFLQRAPRIYWMASFSYVFLYWILPFLISGVIGWILGINVRTKIVYPVTLLVSLVLGPLIPMGVGVFLLSRNGSLYDLYVIFDVGQLDPNAPFYESYGYELNGILWLARLGQLVAVCIMVLFILLKKEKIGNGVKRASLLILAIFLYTVGIYGSLKILRIQKEKYRTSELYNYYGMYRNLSIDELGEGYRGVGGRIHVPYEIQGYDITVLDGLSMNIKVKIEVMIVEKCSNIALTLWHDFSVNSCVVNGTKSGFRQDGDTMIIPSTGEEGTMLELVVEYKGIPPVNLYKDTNKWVLPGLMPWVPVEYVGKAMIDEMNQGELFRYPKDKKAVPVSVCYEGGHDVFCSLYGSGHNKWVGVTSGVTMACGWFEEAYRDGYDIVYPSVCPSDPEHVVQLLNRFSELIPIISGELLEKGEKQISNKVFIFQSLLYNHAPGGIYLLDDHVLMNLSFNNDGEAMDFIGFDEAVAATLRTDGWGCNEEIYVDIFRYAYTTSLENRGLITEDMGEGKKMLTWLEGMLGSFFGRPDDAELCRKMGLVIDDIENKRQVEFFKEYLALLDEGRADYTTVCELIDKYTEE